MARQPRAHAVTRWGDIPPSLIAVGVLAIVPGGLFPHAWLRIAVLAAAVLLHVLAPVVRGRLTRIDSTLLAVGFAWLVVSALSADAPWAAAIGRWPRYEGLPVTAGYIGAAVIGSHVLGGPQRGSNRAWDMFLRTLAMTSIAIGVVALLEATGLRPLGGSPEIRSGSFLGNASDLGAFGVLAAAALLPTALQRRSKLVGAGALASVLTVGLSGSRGAMLGLGAALVVIAAAHVVDRRRRDPAAEEPAGDRNWVFLALAGGVAGASALAVPAVRERLFALSTVEGRFTLWESTMSVLSGRPLTGTGPSGFVDALPAHLSRSAAIQLGSETVHDSPHMWVLQAAVAGGVVLAVIAMTIAVRFVVAGVRVLTAATAPSDGFVGAFAAVVGYGTALMFHFTGPGTTPLAAVLAGAVLARSANREPGTPTLLQAAARVAAGVTATLVLAAALAAAVSEWSLRTATDLVAEGRITGADDAFSAAAGLRPWDPDIGLLAAQAMATGTSEGMEGAPEATIRWASSALEANPLSVEAGIALAVGQINAGDSAGGVATLDALEQRAPHDSLLHLQRGIGRFGLGDVEGALGDLEEAAALDPRSPTPWLVLSRVHDLLGDSAAAAAARAEMDARQP